MIIITPWFSKSFVFKFFSAHTKKKAGRFKFLRFELRALSIIRDGLVRTAGQTVEIKCSKCGRCLKEDKDLNISSTHNVRTSFLLW